MNIAQVVRWNSPRTRAKSGTLFTTGTSIDSIFTALGVASGRFATATSSRSESLRSFRTGFTRSKESSPWTAKRAAVGRAGLNKWIFRAHSPNTGLPGNSCTDTVLEFIGCDPTAFSVRSLSVTAVGDFLAPLAALGFPNFGNAPLLTL
jgi:hypothetical protein